MKKLIGFILAISTIANGAPNATDQQEFLAVNHLVNSGFEGGRYAWTASGGATTTTNSTAKALGNFGYEWDSNGASQTLTSNAVTAINGLKGRDGVAYCSFRTASGTATHTIQAYDGSNILNSKTITSDTSFFRKTEVNFVWPSSGSVSLRVVSVAANEPSLYIDECYLGLANNISQSQALLDWQSYTPTLTTSGGGSITLNATGKTDPNGYWRRVGDTVFISISFRNGSGGAASGSAGDVRIGLPSDIVPDVSGGKMPTIVGGIRADGYGTLGTTTNVVTGANVFNSGYFTLSPDADNSYLQVSDLAASYLVTATISFPVLGWTSQNGTTFENANWKVDANIGGANITLGTASVSSYTGLTSSALTLTNNSGTGNLTAQIGCSSTNSPTGTTCSVGDESIAVSFTPQGQFPQDVEACFRFSWNGEATAGSQIVPAFQVVETATNAQTILQEGRSRVTAGQAAGAGATGDGIFPVHVCGTFTFTSGGQKMLRLFYEQLATGTVNDSAINADGNASVGQRDIHVTVRPITQSNRAPVLIGSVTSNSTGAERVERVRVSVSGGTPSIASQSGSWISSITDNGVGDYTLNMAAGTWSAVPTCTCIPLNSAPNQICVQSSDTAATATVLRLEIGTDTGANSDTSFNVLCMGPR